MVMLVLVAGTTRRVVAPRRKGQVEEFEKRRKWRKLEERVVGLDIN